ncbi:uncharacterized protein DUF1801 [Mumia flava]|uniref:Uncharacterized protein DUF1801 n=1 Tax=Mumia flava TaxID=1348852 RepID=A0A2M9BF87_9ACTN|nr:DUF1801 domain-containing protein [Mumia flava]PJJ56602.1 uncharacterized protein DUF1801 [Mumia flava]
MSAHPTIAAYLETLDAARAETLAALCDLIQDVDPRIEGSIKWNAPSFAITDHFATTGLERTAPAVRLVLHTGARRQSVPVRIVVDDPRSLLSWRGADRATVRFVGVDDVAGCADDLRSILRQWIDQTQGVATRGART